MIIAVGGMIFINSKMAFFVVGGLAGFASLVAVLSRTMVSIFALKEKYRVLWFLCTGRALIIVIGPGVMGFSASGISNWVMNTLVATGWLWQR
jgi:hypothetical protein